MKIQTIRIDHAAIGGGTDQHNEGLCHVKVLPYLSVVQAVTG